MEKLYLAQNYTTCVCTKQGVGRVDLLQNSQDPNTIFNKLFYYKRKVYTSLKMLQKIEGGGRDSYKIY